MIQPWPDKTSSFDFSIDSYFQLEGESEDTGFDTRLAQYALRGRWRMTPGDPFTPRVAGRFNFLDVNSADPALPNRLFDVVAATAWGTSISDDWTLAILGGAGYAGDTAFDNGDA
ncbi:MAG: hypothetical protein MI741_15155, partial [Rhodospirillales bacterium]|nr:hypothetical protein [Rhodospirillales bacterium]